MIASPAATRVEVRTPAAVEEPAIIWTLDAVCMTHLFTASGQTRPGDGEVVVAPDAARDRDRRAVDAAGRVAPRAPRSGQTSARSGFPGWLHRSPPAPLRTGRRNRWRLPHARHRRPPPP